MADKPEYEAGEGTMRIRLSAALEAAASARQDLATALAHERTLLRTMIDMIPAFIYAKDVESRFIAINAHLARNMGTTSEDAIGKTDFSFHKRELAEKFFADEQALIKSGKEIRDLEEPGFDQVTGEERTVVTSKVPLRDENDDIIGIIGIGFDITERKRAEQRLASGERLESIGRLAAGVAHEINTPIQYLNDSVAFIRDALHDILAHNAKLQAKLPEEPIDEESRSWGRVAAGARAHGGRPGTHRRDRAVYEGVFVRRPARDERGRSQSRDQQHARDRAQRIQVRRGRGSATRGIAPTCHGGQINQVVLNLVVNAAHAIGDCVKGTHEKGLITVRTYTEDGYAVIMIGDTGGGIPEHIRKRIFEPFFTTKQVGKGTGQGLSIAHSVVKGHGGSLEFQSEMGVGTTFSCACRWPRRKAATEVA